MSSFVGAAKAAPTITFFLGYYAVTWFCSRLPRRAPQVLLGLARRGAAWMPRVGRRAGRPLYRPPTKPRSAGRSGNRAAFSLGTF